MYIYMISQSVNKGYDTYDSAVVYAHNDKDAITIHPNGYDDPEWWLKNDEWSTWDYDLTNITVEKLGVAKEGATRGVICASFNAG